MATINNSDLSKELIDGAKIQISHDVVPNQLAEKVVPVMEVNPKLLRVCNIVRSTLLVAPTTIYTTPANRNFYLCSAFVQCSTKADVDAARIITVTIDGQSQVLIQNNVSGGPAGSLGTTNSDLTINPSNPIKIDRGTAIVISGSGTFGSAGIIGYTVED